MSISELPEDLLHGSEVIHSRYVRETMYSAEAGVIFDSRFTSRSHSFLASAVIPASSTFLRSSSISCIESSDSPSSFWMAFICSRSRYSRWFWLTCSCTCSWIFERSSKTSSSFESSRISVSSLLRTLEVSINSWRSSVESDGRVPAMKSVKRPGLSMFIAAVCRSSESCGEWLTTSRKRSCALRCSASSSVSASPIMSGSACTRACRNGRKPISSST